ncbi:MAG: hypothetical protein HY329_03765 [Chloroflexi bacterium]|nr:hypothetical protein [Chloroflexota bacterium]
MASAPPIDGSTSLSAGELELLSLFARGLTPSHVAAMLGIARTALDTQVSALCTKLGTPSHDQAVYAGFALGHLRVT